MPRAPLALALALLLLLSTGVRAYETGELKDLRGDEGLLTEIRPTGAAFLAPDRILVCDARYNQFHIFDPDGRRYRRLDVNRPIPQAWYNGIALLQEGGYLMVGSHYQDKNNLRYVYARSVLHLYDLRGETISDDSAKVNYTPDPALRRTGFYGQNTTTPLEIGGIGIDARQKRLFFGLTRPFGDKGEVIIYEARLPEILDQKKDLELKDAKSKLVPDVDPAVGEPFRLADLAYVQGKGLLVLMSSQSADGKRFGTNQLWILPGGFGPAKKIADGIAPGNHGAGLAVLEEAKNTYSVALTFDNNPEETNLPSRLLILKGVKL